MRVSLPQASSNVSAGWSSADQWLYSIHIHERPDLAVYRAVGGVLEKAGSVPFLATHRGIPGAFQGELFNKDAFLEKDGPQQSDAEAVVQAYSLFKTELASRIQGHYHAVIVDGASLYAARDPLGVMPLFYSERNGEWLFSSSMDTLLLHPGVPREINRVVVAERLSELLSSAEDTYYTPIRRVPPGHFLVATPQGTTVKRYWNPPVPGVDVDWATEQELPLFDELFQQAIRRCAAGRRTGIFLSGGLDSVSIAAVASQMRPAEIPELTALSLFFPDPECNEEDVQRKVAQQLNLEQVSLKFHDALSEGGLVLDSIQMANTWPAPLDNVWLPAYRTLATQGVRKGCQGILTGAGGDEWLTVTPLVAADLIGSLKFADLYRLWDSSRLSYRLPLLAMTRNVLWSCGLRPLLGSYGRRTLLQVAPGMLKKRYRKRIERLVPHWLHPDPALNAQLIERSMGDPASRDEFSFYVTELRQGWSHPLVVSEIEENHYLGEHVGTTMRFPFWDAELIEFLQRVPPSLLLQGGRSKGMVRQMVSSKFPGLDFERRRKVVATDFLATIIKSGMKTGLEHLRGIPALSALGLVNTGEIKNLILFAESASFKYFYRIWNICVVEAWLQRHFPG